MYTVWYVICSSEVFSKRRTCVFPRHTATFTERFRLKTGQVSEEVFGDACGCMGFRTGLVLHGFTIGIGGSNIS